MLFNVLLYELIPGQTQSGMHIQLEVSIVFLVSFLVLCYSFAGIGFINPSGLVPISSNMCMCRFW